MLGDVAWRFGGVDEVELKSRELLNEGFPHLKVSPFSSLCGDEPSSESSLTCSWSTSILQ